MAQAVAQADTIDVAERLARELFRLVRLIERSKEQAAAAEPGKHMERALLGLLVQLVDNGPQRTKALAEAVYADPSTVSRQVGQLVQLGLVERCRGRIGLIGDATDLDPASHASIVARQETPARSAADCPVRRAARAVEALARQVGPTYPV